MRYTIRMLDYLSNRRFSTLVAKILSFHTNQIIRSNGNKKVKNILLLPKLGFNQDMESCFQEIDGYNVYSLKRKLLKTVYYTFLPKEIDDNNYRSNNSEVESAKDELRNFWFKVLNHYLRLRPIDVVMSGNFSYASEQEFAAALSMHGVHFVAAHKECLKTPGLEPFYTAVYRTRKNPFQGTKICVYNEIEAGIEKAAGIADPDNIIVTGMARMDRLHHLRSQRKPPRRPLILFFSFNPKAGLPIIGRKISERFEKLDKKDEQLNVKRLTTECHQAMVDIARENPDVQVVIKTKGDGQALITLRGIWGEKPDLPPNLEIMAGGDLLQVLTDSCVVTGFNSTALLEAVALGVDVVTPQFYESVDPKIHPYILDLGDAVRNAVSISEYKTMLVDCARSAVGKTINTSLGEKQAALLNHWLGNPDGKAAERIRSVINQLPNI